MAAIVIDDGSGDGTGDAAARLQARFPKVRLTAYPHNRGCGAAVRTGPRLGRETGTDYVVCLHADGQYPPERLPAFIGHMAANGIDVLQGSRHREGGARQGGMPLYKIVAGKVLTWMENRAFGLSMTDYHSGFLLYSRRAVETIPFDRLSHYFDFHLEVIPAPARACCASPNSASPLAMPAKNPNEPQSASLDVAGSVRA